MMNVGETKPKRRPARTGLLAREPNDRLRGGARRLILTNPARLDYITQGLTDITGYTREEMRELFDDEFARIVHPDDRAAFYAFDDELRRGEAALTMSYRIICKDGSIATVQDTMDSHQMEDGTMVGYSLVVQLDHNGELGNVEAMPDGRESAEADGKEDSATQHLPFDDDETHSVPFGIVEFRADDHAPTYISDQLWHILGVADDQRETALERMGNNVLNMVPSVDLTRWRANMEDVNVGSEPCVFDTHLWHADGYLIEVTGWLSLLAVDGENRYRLVLVDITRKRNRERANRRSVRMEHFSTLYDILFLMDTGEQSALCFKFDDEASFGNPVPFDTTGSIRIMLPDAVNYLVNRLACDEDQEALRAFFEPLMGDARTNGTAPAQGQDPARGSISSRGPAAPLARLKTRIVFKPRESESGRSYEATLIDAEAGAYFFGCRMLDDPAQALVPGAHAEGRTIVWLPNSHSGTVLVSVEGDRTHILFANERGRSLFAGNAISGSMMSMEGLLKICPITHEQMNTLMQEGELTVTGVRSPIGITSWRLVRVRESASSTRDMVMVFELPDNMQLAGQSVTGRQGEGEASPYIFIRTFGYFDVFLNGKAITFNSSKAKELLALLVDRRGGFVSANEAIAYLWEDEPATPVVLARHRKIAMRLKNILDEHGIGHIVETVNGKRCLNTSAVTCDLYEYLAGKPGITFSGTYLQNYSWGEITLGELLNTLPFQS